MPIGAIGATVGLGKAAAAGTTALKGFKLGSSLKGAWDWISNRGFSLTSGKWNVRKRAQSIDAGLNGFDLTNAVGGLTTNEMLAIAGAAYLLFKK